MLRNSIGSHSFTCYSVDYHLLFLCSCRWVEGIGKRRNLIKVERRNLNSENDRVLANRESAAHSKERRTHYTMETEQKALTLQPQSIQFSVDDLAKIEKEISDMKAKNRDLECEIEAINNETKLIRERNESLRVQLSLLKEERRQRLAFKHNNLHTRLVIVDVHQKFMVVGTL
ncbi:probable transcription factor PosF21 [Prosopis cineraria]|uniref:probable transcription factor PosF21 n=1 Tax=Prosopis cineraria TaxID=364024 RepID=UPI00241030AA|nr:probable transcription factor PosF21 [Prosopis cineraria]